MRLGSAGKAQQAGASLPPAPAWQLRARECSSQGQGWVWTRSVGGHRPKKPRSRQRAAALAPLPCSRCSLCTSFSGLSTRKGALRAHFFAIFFSLTIFPPVFSRPGAQSTSEASAGAQQLFLPQRFTPRVSSSTCKPIPSHQPMRDWHKGAQLAASDGQGMMLAPASTWRRSARLLPLPFAGSGLLS